MLINSFRQNYFLICLFLSFFTIVSVFTVEFFFKIPPCELCLYQRIPYFVILILSIFFLKFDKFRFKFLLIFFCFFSTSILSLFHSLVERGIVEYQSSCTSSSNNFENIEELRSFLEEAPLVKCDEISFSIFGLSFANINFLLSTFFLVFSLFVLKSNYEK
tara:strand:+ start:1285 stop:1767 length:483 start_codon:yes stop_codon:yes gene_type:complete